MTFPDVLNDDDGQESVTEESPLLADDHSPPNDDRSFLKKPHILWMLPFSFILSTIISSTIAPLVQIVINLVCEEYSDIDNSAIIIDDDKCRSDKIHRTATNYLMVYQALLYTSVTLSIGYLSMLSDYKGRIFIFRISIFGTIFAFLTIIMVANYSTIIGIKLIFVGAIVEGLCGGIIAINTACHAYASDCTPPENRSLYFGLMNAFAFFGMTIGPTLGALIIEKTDSVLSIFYAATFAQILFLLFVIFVLPESLTSRSRRNNQQQQQQQIEEGHHFQKNTLLSSLSRLIQNIFSALIILNEIPRRTNHNNDNELLRRIGRWTLYILGTIYFIYRISQAGQNEIIALYTIYRFKWTTWENGIFYSLQSFTRFIALICFLPLCKFIHSKYISSRYNNNNNNITDSNGENATKQLDIWLMRFGLMMESIGFAVFASASDPNMFYLGCIFTSISTIISPTIRSVCISFVSPMKTGQILGALSVIEGIGSILSPLWMNSLYSYSMKNFPELVFWTNAGLFIVATFLGLLVW